MIYAAGVDNLLLSTIKLVLSMGSGILRASSIAFNILLRDERRGFLGALSPTICFSVGLPDKALACVIDDLQVIEHIRINEQLSHRSLWPWDRLVLDFIEDLDFKWLVYDTNAGKQEHDSEMGLHGVRALSQTMVSAWPNISCKSVGSISALLT